MRIAICDKIGLCYDGDTLNKQGLGGSESAVILISKELAKIGFTVTVFNNCNDGKNSKSGTYDGVRYIDNSDVINHSEQYDIVIVSRTAEPFVSNRYPFIKDAKIKCLWLHDTFCEGDQFVEDLVVNKKIDWIFTLSDFHTDYILNCDHGKKRNYEVLKKHIFHTRNGAVNYIPEVDLNKKDVNHFVYNASVTKGLIPLIEFIWPEIKKNIPHAHLTIIGGYYRFRENSEPDAQEKTLKNLIKDERLKSLDINFTDVIPQYEIAKILANANFMIYPGAFPETFGISTLESLLYNTPLITTRFGALEETAIDMACYHIDYAIEPNSLFPTISKQNQINKFVNKVLEAYNNPYLHQQKQNYCSIVKDVAGWDTVALQWKQFFYRIMGEFLSVDEYRKVKQINEKINRIFGRTMEMPNNVDYSSSGLQKEIVVISPFRNSEKYLKKCILSVVQQDYVNYKHIIINDNSTDDSMREVLQTIVKLPEYIQNKFEIVQNDESVGAVKNQIDWIRKQNDDAIILLLDGDDWLINNNTIFHYYNQLYDDVEFTYGSCWSLADNIPLIAQDYPTDIKNSKKYRNHHFNWILPYTHLRTFKKSLINNLNDSNFQDENNNWYKAGGDGSVFYALIEQANPDKVKAIKDIVYVYNDLNPLNDYKVNGEEQNKNANKIVNKISHRPNNDTIKMTNDIKNIEHNRKQNKKILIAIPTNKYIRNEVFMSLWNLDVPKGYELDFQYFYGYCRSQILNLICEWGKKYDAFLLVNKNIILEKNTLIDCVNEGVDLVSIDDTKSIFVSGNILRRMNYPHFTSEETEITERQKFINLAKDIGASYRHIIGKTKTVSNAIII
jgi:glycosyltransferase involved in cell wall biosynthesis